MARVSLVLPIVPGWEPDRERIARLQRELEGQGHAVEVVVAVGSDGAAAAVDPSWRLVRGERPGRVAAAIAGVAASQGEQVLVADLGREYAPGDAARVLGAIGGEPAVKVVGSRHVSPGGRLRLRGRFWSLVSGTSDPFTGLLGLDQAAFARWAHEMEGVGSQFALEFLAKVRGVRVDVPARAVRVAGLAQPALGLGDLKHLKKLADHRYGNLSRLFQFCVVGASGMVVDLTTYAGLQGVLGRAGLAGRSLPGVGPLDLAVSAVLAVWLALTWNFTLNRRLTFSDARHGSIVRQYLTYAMSNALAIAVSLLVRLRLPHYVGFFDRHKLAAALVGIVMATGISFTMSRWLVFRKRQAAGTVVTCSSSR